MMTMLDKWNNWEQHTYKFKGKRTLHQSVHGLGWFQDKDKSSRSQTNITIILSLSV